MDVRRAQPTVALGSGSGALLALLALMALVACGDGLELTPAGPDGGDGASPDDEVPHHVPPPAIDAPPALGNPEAPDDDDDPSPVFDADPDDSSAPPAPLPIVLVHGFSGFTDLGPLGYFYGVVDHLAESDSAAFAPAQPPYQATELRAEVLGLHLDDILAATGQERAHLICHSQGGLDCRYLASRLGYADRVASITTIATPHRGTPLADLADVAPNGLVNPAGRLLGWLLGFLEGEPPDDDEWDDDESVSASWAPDLVAAVDAMTELGSAQFNEQTPDHPLVPVFSVAGVSRNHDGGDLCEGGVLWDGLSSTDSLDPLLFASGLVIAGSGGRPNDGIVPTDSMAWGTFLGCIAADHFDQVGQIADGPGAPFDHLAFYGELVAFLRTLEAPAAP